jgi:hypothetical protein
MDRVHEIIDEVVGILRESNVDNWDEGLCTADVSVFIEIIRKVRPPDFSKLRDQLRAAVRSLTEADRAIEKINQVSVFKSLQDNHIRPALDATSFYAQHMSFRSGGAKTRDGKSLNTDAKRAAAVAAHALILRWTNKRPTQSAQGPYFHLARLLFEAATGKPADEGTGIERQCRDYANWAKSQA